MSDDTVTIIGSVLVMFILFCLSYLVSILNIV